MSLRDHSSDLPEENGFVLGKLAVPGEQGSDTEIWAGSAGGLVWNAEWLHPPCALVALFCGQHKLLPPSILRGERWLH